jgi:hypothetical protein
MRPDGSRSGVRGSALSVTTRAPGVAIIVVASLEARRLARLSKREPLQRFIRMFVGVRVLLRRSESGLLRNSCLMVLSCLFRFEP